MKFRLGFLLALLPGFAFAQQGGVLQSGTVTPGHPAKWVFDNVIGDAGGANNGSLTDVGITNTGTPFCINDAPITALGGYHRFCLGANSTSVGGGALTYNAYGGAQPLPFKCVINGVTFDNCFQGGGVGPPGPPGPAAPVACPNITSFGGSGNGSTDNVPALAAALATQGRGNACVSFPPGQFKFLSTFSHTYSSAAYESITLQGSGDGVTEIIGPNNAGAFVLTLNGAYNSFHIRDMSIETPSACASCIGLSVIQSATPLPNPAETAQSDITRVSFFGTDRSPAVPSGTNYWGTAFKDEGVSQINFFGDYIQGLLTSGGPAPSPAKGIWIVGNASQPPVVFNFTATTINEYYYGLYIDNYDQGFTISGGNFTNNFYGVYVAAAAISAPGQLSITNSAMNNCENVFLNAFSAGTLLSNNYFISGNSPFPCGSTQTSVELGGAAFFSIITNNLFGSSSTTNTIAIHDGLGTSGSPGGIATGNMINNFGIGVVLDGSVRGFVLANNTITASITGISIGSTASFNRIAGNVLLTNTTDLMNAAPLNSNYIDIPQDCSSISGMRFGGATTGITYGTRACRLSVVGKSANVDFHFVLTSKGSSTGNATVDLPVAATVAEPGSSGIVGFYNNVTGANGISLQLTNAQAGATFLSPSATGVIAMTNTNFTNTSEVVGHLTYGVD